MSRIAINASPPSTSISHTLKIPEHLSGIRLDQALSKLLPEYSRSRLTQWIREGCVQRNNQPVRPRDKTEAHQIITLKATLIPTLSWGPEALPLDILYEDDTLLVINKPPGLVVHPGAGNPRHTLLNALLHYAPELAQVHRAGIVHRLDKDTSGILVIARSVTAHQALVQALQKRTIVREYEAIVQRPIIAGGSINAPIGRHPKQRTRMAIVNSGKPAITHYRILHRWKYHTHLRINLETGRTHQIRVHMAHIKHPLLGDPLYGERLQLFPDMPSELISYLRGFQRQALHARRLSLVHPKTQCLKNWTAPLPPDFTTLIKRLDLIN